ncbi:MAG: hypothetical protein MRJ93_00385 [Nitrososphaeraceae archaeon]|nr:hypothetical protein [Nitrososphaeraceae archaeon]
MTKKIFTQMFSIPLLYNTACTLSVKPIRIQPILMSILLYFYKQLDESKENNRNNRNQFNITQNKINTTLDNYFNQPLDSVILSKEIQSWQKFSIGLRKNDRELFRQMLNSCYEYLSSIKAMGNESSTESLFLTILFEQHKQLRILS